MDRTTSVVERTHQEPGVDEQPPRFPRKAIDTDAGLVVELQREEEGAAEGLIGAYGNERSRQDALWMASRKIDTFRGAAAFGSWVYRITANTAYEKLRRRRSRQNEVSWEDLGPAFDEKVRHVEVAVDWSRRLKDPAIETELKSVLSAAIDELPADYRTAFVLHDVEGLSNPEIAEILQTKLAAIKSRVHRARLFLQGRVAGYA
jgi:RNA polymerase sigma-70 factor (ECF subfamily)